MDGYLPFGLLKVAPPQQNTLSLSSVVVVAHHNWKTILRQKTPSKRENGQRLRAIIQFLASPLVCLAVYNPPLPFPSRTRFFTFFFFFFFSSLSVLVCARAMSDGVNAGFVRSEQLKSEWARLRSEMDTLRPDEPSHAARRTAIQARMAQITTDMSAVLTETRKLIPTPDIDDAESDLDVAEVQLERGGEPFIQYSRNHLHVIQRTYDSSDGEEEEHNAAHGGVVDIEEEVPEAPVPAGLEEGEEVEEEGGDGSFDVGELREQMMDGANLSTSAVVTVEARAGDKGLRAGLGDLRHRLKDRLKIDASGGSALTEEERESLTLEQSRLEREARKLKRLPERSRQEQRRLEEVVAKIAKNAQKLDTREQNGEVEDEESTGSMASAERKPSQRIERKKTMFFGRASKAEKREDGREAGAVGTVGMVGNALAPKMTMERGSAVDTGTPSRRKKGWMTLEAGMASIRGFGRSLRVAAKGKEREGMMNSGGMDDGNEGTNRKKMGYERGAEGNVFTQAAQRVAQRGEKLEGVAEGSEQMATDAGDMLGAARALKQRNQRGGLFS